MVRAALAAEQSGIPSVSIVCEGFERQASATARGHGFDGAALAVLDGHVDAQTTDEMIGSFIATGVDQIVDGLTAAADTPESQRTTEPTSLEVVASGSLAEVHTHFLQHGWSDGSPIIPPTRETVEAFISPSGHDPWRVLGVAKSSGRDVSVWSIAVNAVMAGCSPEHLPVLLAAAEILVAESYGAEHSGNTTGADALMILDGPSASELGFECGPGALRDGVHANTAVGRWLRLYLRNVFEFTPDKHDKATFGNTFRVVLAEDHAVLTELGWSSVSEDFGVTPGADALTMARMNSGIIVGSVYGATSEQIVQYLADGLARVAGWDLTHVYGLGREQFRPLLVLSPILARTVASSGWSKDDLREALFTHARISARRFENLIGQWTNLTAGRLSLVEHVAQGHMPAVFAESDDPDRLVPIVSDPSKFVIAVAGDPNRTNAYVMANDGPHGDWTSRLVDRSISTDLQCSI